MRRSDGVVRSKGEKGKRETEPVVKHCVEHMECTMRRRRRGVIVTVSAVRGAESEE